MPSTRPDLNTLLGQPTSIVPMAVQRMLAVASPGPQVWVGPKDAKKLGAKTVEAYALAHDIMKYLCIEAPRKHASGHPGGPLSAFTFSFALLMRRDRKVDAPLRMGAGHLSLLAYGLQYLGGKEGSDKRLASPQAIIDNFR